MTEAEALERVRALKADRDGRFSEEEIREAFKVVADITGAHEGQPSVERILRLRDHVMTMMRRKRMQVAPPPSEAPTEK